jgi:hypothetical protein
MLDRTAGAGSSASDDAPGIGTAGGSPVTEDERDRQERDELETHMQQEGGCRALIFLGECRICERYFDLEDRMWAREHQP